MTLTQSLVALRVDIALGDDERCDAASPAVGRDARLGVLGALGRKDFDGDGAPTDDVVDRSSRASSMTSPRGVSRRRSVRHSDANCWIVSFVWIGVRARVEAVQSVIWRSITSVDTEN
tara:strand:- start:746 stop:1099 length:354 start_codon:yes stop_codon:yes gene_type:complete